MINIIYNRRAKLFYQVLKHPYIICEDNEIPDLVFSGKRLRKSKSWREYQTKDHSIHLYKNTGTIWDNGYWTKYERHRLNKQSRLNAKIDLKRGEDIPYERINIK